MLQDDDRIVYGLFKTSAGVLGKAVDPAGVLVCFLPCCGVFPAAKASFAFSKRSFDIRSDTALSSRASLDMDRKDGSLLFGVPSFTSASWSPNLCSLSGQRH